MPMGKTSLLKQNGDEDNPGKILTSFKETLEHSWDMTSKAEKQTVYEITVSTEIII